MTKLQRLKRDLETLRVGLHQQTCAHREAVKLLEAERAETKLLREKLEVKP